MRRNYQMPATPFSTPMAGSRSLLRDRIRQICAPGRRPAGRAALLLMLAVCLSSVNLVSCQTRPGPLEQYREQVKTASCIQVEMPMYSSLAFPEPIAEADLLDQARAVLEQAEPAENPSGEDFSDAAVTSMGLALGDAGAYRLSQGDGVCWLAEAGEDYLDPFEPIGVLPETAMVAMEQLARIQLSRHTQVAEAGSDASSEVRGEEDSRFRELLLAYYGEIFQGQELRWNEGEMLSAPEGTTVLGPAEYLGSMSWNGEETESLYRLEMREIQEGAAVSWEDNLVALARDPAGNFLRVDGIRYPDLTEEPLEDTIRRTAWGISSLEMALFPDGSPEPLCVGKGMTSFRDQTPMTVPLEESGPVYAEGNAWVRQTWPGLEITGYYAAASGNMVPYILDVTGTGFATWRDIRVGDSRETVEKVYPELQRLDGTSGRWSFWGIPEEDLESGDVLWYNVTGTEMAPENLLFFFEDDTLSRVVIHTEFD